MNDEKTTLDPEKEAETDRPDLVKKIGKTTYKVKAHFNPNSRETMSDKIKRLLRNEICQK